MAMPLWTSAVIALLACWLLYVFLSKVVFGPVMDIMEQRKRLMDGSIGFTQRAQTEYAGLIEEQKNMIRQARQEALTILEASRTESGKQAQQILDNAKAEILKQKEEHLLELEQEVDRAKKAMEGQIEQLSGLIVKKIMV